MSRWIFIQKAMLDKIADICSKDAFRESCGLITGIDVLKRAYYAEDAFRISNIKNKESNIDYLMEPQEMFNILKHTTIKDKTADNDLVAIWHSHPLPFGEPIPSHIDLNMVSFNVIYIIYGLKSNTFKAWYLSHDKKQFKEAIMQII